MRKLKITERDLCDMSEKEREQVAQILRVLSCIPIGSENKISLSDLCKLMHLKESSTKKCVRTARACGYTILSDIHGYWQIDTSEADYREQIEKYLNSTKRGAKERFITISTINKRFNNMPGQQNFRKEFEK